jgi:hypothetical protein
MRERGSQGRQRAGRDMSCATGSATANEEASEFGGGRGVRKRERGRVNRRSLQIPSRRGGRRAELGGAEDMSQEHSGSVGQWHAAAWWACLSA